MKTSKTLMTLLLALLLPVTAIALPPTNYNLYEFEVDGIYYKIEGDVACVSCQRWENGMHLSDYHGDVVIPSTVTYQGTTYPVTIIDDYAFNYCSGLTSITIPESITTIGGSAFYLCTGLTRVTITDMSAWCNMDIQFNPLVYAQHLFLNDTEVTNLVIPDDVTAIKNYAFQGCSGLKSLLIPNSVTSIGDNAFEDCSGLTSISIPNSVTEIGQVAFECCTSLTSVTLGNAVATIGNAAFQGCTALKSIEIPNSVTAIKGAAFWGCTALTSVTLGKCVTFIGNGAFKGCEALESIDIPNSVTEIGSHAFSDCTNLTGVTIGNSVATIGKDAFQNAPAIETITCKAATPPTWDDMSMFTANVYNHTPLHVPVDRERYYKSNPNWGQFLNIIGDVRDNPIGDVNDDGEVTIADANNVVDIVVMGGNSGHNRAPQADVNGDGEVNIADVNAIIDLIIKND